jgi:hypothetical protein
MREETTDVRMDALEVMKYMLRKSPPILGNDHHFNLFYVA